MVANFTSAFTLISDTALLYHHRPKTSVAVSILGALTSTILGLWLIPQYHLTGAALSIAGAFFVRMLISHWMAYRVTGYSALVPTLAAIAALGTVASAAGSIRLQPLPIPLVFVAKGLVVVALLSCTYFLYKKSFTGPCKS